MNAVDRAIYAANREKSMDETRAWRKANPERALEIRRRNAAKHKERYASMRAEWMKANEAHMKEWVRAYYAENSERILEYACERRKLLASLPDRHTDDEWLDLCERHSFRCACCKADEPLTRDHIIPLSLGGLDVISNIQPLCRGCNSRKHQDATDYRISV
ncbi:MAG TPA: HNH endonuclease [Bryobacteraceae bacterium]|nr:HNH endonuclease [Bryobacteraceae bacterium]